LEAPVRSRNRAMCFFTVPSDTPARRAISLFVRPDAIAVTISR
jgi:hypothetical protein